VKPALLGGDVAVVFSGSRQGASLISWLTQEDGFASWIAAGGFISPLRGAAGDYDPSVRSYASIVADPEQPGVEARFDLSDQLDGQVGESIGPVLQELFTSVAFGSSTGAGEAEAAAVAAASRLSGAAGGPPCEPG
jgi:hypothetical protein